jgi:hypothetical protein
MTVGSRPWILGIEVVGSGGSMIWYYWHVMILGTAIDLSVVGLVSGNFE